MRVCGLAGHAARPKPAARAGPHTGQPVEEVLNEGIYPLVPQRRWLDSQEAAGYAVFLASEEARRITGPAMVNDGGNLAQYGRVRMRDPAGQDVGEGQRHAPVRESVAETQELSRDKRLASTQHTSTGPLPWGFATEYASTPCGRYAGRWRLRAIRGVLADRTATRTSGGLAPRVLRHEVQMLRADEPDGGFQPRVVLKHHIQGS